MKKVYTLNLNVLANKNLSVQECVILISLTNIDFDVDIQQKHLESLEEKGFIKIIIEENEQIEIVKKKGKLFIESLQDNESNIANTHKITKRPQKFINTEINDFITTFRELWKGLKPGSMGSHNSCNEKMTRWMIENPSYTKEDILKASKAYLKSVNDYRFLQAADYFIYKKDTRGESSRLSAFIDEADTPNDEWSSQLS